MPFFIVSPAAKGGEFMGLFSKKEKEIVYPFSGFEGQLLYKGEPAAGAKITRKYNQMDKDKFEETITADAEGRFKFESIAVEYNPPALRALDYMSHQSIFVKYNNEEFQIWGGGKGDREEFAEFNGQPKNLICEITGDIRRVDAKKGFVGTACYWDV